MRFDEDRIFSEALSIEDDDKREAFLDLNCAHVPGLKPRILELLESYHEGDFLEDTPQEIASLIQSVSGECLVNKLAGPYRLLEMIGSGGMGIVYLAERNNDDHETYVAVKVLRPGVDSDSVMARFNFEQLALEMLDHPNIAKYIEGGIAEFDRPYFAMEWVDGLAISEYCDRFKLSIETRLELFLELCRAVQYAHERGIAHRDLKPSNLLVIGGSTKPVPKVIDFGIAKAMMADFDCTLPHTRATCMLGTPHYMSPEQMMWSPDVDLRTDIYSMGVVLFELLTGVTPLQFSRKLRETEKTNEDVVQRKSSRPSDVLATLDADTLEVECRRRATEPDAYLKTLHQSLDWIVLKAIAHSRAERYSQISQLGDDIEAVLNGRKPSVGPPGLVSRCLDWYYGQQVLINSMSVLTVALALMLAWLGPVTRSRLPSGSAQPDRTEVDRANHAETLQAMHGSFVQDIIDSYDLPHTHKHREATELLTKWKRSESPYKNHFLVGLQDRLRLDVQKEFVEGHASDILDMKVSPDAKWLVSSHKQGDILIRDRVTGGIVKRLHPTDGEVTRICFSPDSGRMVTVGTDTIVRLWKVDDFSAEHLFTGHERTINGLDWSPDGKKIATGDRDGVLKVWDVENKTLVYSIDTGSDALRTLKFAPNGKTLAVARGGQPIKLFSVEDGVEVGEIHSPGVGVLAIEFTPNGKWLLFGGYGEAILYLADTEILAVKRMVATEGFVCSICCVDNDHYLVGDTFGHTNCYVRQLNGVVASLRDETAGDDEWIRSIQIATADGNVYIASDKSRRIGQYSLASWVGFEKLDDLPTPVEPAEHSKLEIKFASDRTSIREVGSQRELWALPNATTTCTPRFVPKLGAVLISGFEAPNHFIDVFSLNGQRLHERLEVPFEIAEIVVSSDARYLLATGFDGGQVRVWSLDTFEHHDLVPEKWPYTSLADFTADGQHIVIGQSGTTHLSCLRTDTWETVATAETASDIGSMLRMPSGKFIVGETNGFSVWPEKIKSPLWSIRHPQPNEHTKLFGLAVTPDESTIAGYHGDGTLSFYDTQSHRHVATRHLAKLGLRRMVFSDGQTLRIDSTEGTLLLGQSTAP